MRLMVCGDLHLDAFTAGFPRFDDVARSLRAAVKLAKRERCDGFVQLGDLSDPGPRAHRCSALAIEVASTLASAGIWSRWLVGNHDVVEDGSGSSTLSPLAAAWRERNRKSPRGFEDCAVWSDPTAQWLEASDVAMIALPHPARGHSYEPASYVLGLPNEWSSASRVLIFGHLTVPGIEPGSETRDMPRGREVRYPIEAIRERWGDRAVMINGHYHRSYRRSQSQVIVPGSLERLTRGEAGNDPSIFILEV